MNKSQVFDFQVSLTLSRLQGFFLDSPISPERGQWKDAHPETLRALKDLSEAIDNLDNVVNKHLENVEEKYPTVNTNVMLGEKVKYSLRSILGRKK